MTMIELLTDIVKNKNVLILGFGKEGQSTYNLLNKLNVCKRLDISDIKMPDYKFSSETMVYTGDTYLDCLDSYDLVFKSPGVVLPKDIHEYKCRITSQTEVFLAAYRRQVIGITGTKGKSTVSTLLYHVLSNSNVKCILAGNIGTPVFDVIDNIDKDTVIVLELSCHQLEYCNYSPAIAVLLNIYEDHLDHYKSFEAYKKAKKNIFLHQHASDTLYCGEEVILDNDEAISRVFYINADILPFKSFESIGDVKLKGVHNLKNCAFVYAISKNFGVSDDGFISLLQTYKPLRHRLEYIGTKHGVEYYDDSISTTVESTINAIKSIENVETIILGGMDRGIDYTNLIRFLLNSKIKNILLIYESGKRIYELFKQETDLHNKKIIYCSDLERAIKMAQDVTSKGTACLLSPASASYGHFKNFEERGDAFKHLLFDY
ncbi:UDP-N-acetylmuramoylalanine--D-glutamate ligase [Herbinix hemicellulosilytica]|mgnify:CR=1 FL=1|uniref:UDP-N-acetylmuramoylalanine--D-glutamate ligase n=2 Tax=Herbinix hemicellulosilytica TaxID=1564487 RepID=A0A0H5SDS5_HERHM|nr:UDP-N-acetylmuramoylalanine--D-glutamate ligase [Herbinix hemicellulosilytica]CRZ33534.1 hypothetical protein HHT355_0324 [Herbinix hemicellulosilytica]